MSNRDEHKKLMVDWAGDRLSGTGRFIADGPFDWDEWEAAKLRVLFLLKEAYDKDAEPNRWPDDIFRGTPLAENWTLSSVVRDAFVKGPGSSIPRTWKNLFLWARALHNFDSTKPPMEELPKDRGEIWKILGRCAFVNLKKYGGATTSDGGDIQQHLGEAPSGNGKTNFDLIQQQIHLLAPDVVFCCGTYDILRSKAGRESSGLLDHHHANPDVKCGMWRSNGMTWIDYWHPGWFSVPSFLLLQGIFALQVRFYGSQNPSGALWPSNTSASGE